MQEGKPACDDAELTRIFAAADPGWSQYKDRVVAILGQWLPQPEPEAEESTVVAPGPATGIGSKGNAQG